LKEIAREIGDATRNMAVWTIQLIAGYLLDCILFPLTLFIVLYLISKGIFAFLADAGRSRSLQKDLEAVAGKFFSPRT